MNNKNHIHTKKEYQNRDKVLRKIGYYAAALLKTIIPPKSDIGVWFLQIYIERNNRIYLPESGKRIFESTESDVSNWTNISINFIKDFSYTHSVIVCYKDSLYFV